LVSEVHEVPTTQVPEELQVSVSFDPSQPTAPATQEPVQAPFTHVLLIEVHDVPTTQVPDELQVWVSLELSQP
jgi:hypothetical protein